MCFSDSKIFLTKSASLQMEIGVPVYFGQISYRTVEQFKVLADNLPWAQESDV